MAGGVIVIPSGGKDYPGRMTVFVFLTCLVAATGGLIFGYDIGISGGVTSMDTFLSKFFPSVYRKEKEDTGTNQYCNFDSLLLTSFTSSLYLAALVSGLLASTVTRLFGRKASMFCGGLSFVAGAAINGFARNVFMLILGRILLGVGIGFGNQSVPLYLSEMAPPKLRGMLNIGFQQMITIGIQAANLINYGTSKMKGDIGWRLSLGLAVVPGLIITLGSLLLPDTPNSLVERGHNYKAKTMLSKIRGTEDIHDEYNDLVAASRDSKLVKHPWSNILQRKHRPHLTMALLIPFFQQITGINVIMFYAPVLFKTLGFGSNASLMSAVITGLVNMLSTFVSIFSVDKVGRRALLLEGGTQMSVAQVVVGTLIWIKFGVSGEATLSMGYAAAVVIFICVFVAGYAWSWGPLGWLVPSEIFPLEIRPAGLSINVAVNMFFTYAIAQAFLAVLCHMKFGIFYFFTFWTATMSIFVYFFLPETKNIPIEEMSLVWKNHWYWGKYVAEEHDIKAQTIGIEMGK